MQTVDKQNFISELKFKGRWRNYQARILNELEKHLNDRKLNVVAAPGAGKTTLGIEVLVRLKKKSLILAPTITIRNQWKQRIVEGFLKDKKKSSFISTSGENIKDITVLTYQTLHSVFKNTQRKERFIQQLKSSGIKTLVMDEAHHLRTEWYKTLNELCGFFDKKNFTTISLTATPPYDVSSGEWNNYHSLCGSVDAEISVPELVKAGDLCPHQDLIYFSNLTDEEQKMVFDFEKNRTLFFEYINKNSDFLYSVKSSAFLNLNEMVNNIEIIYEDTDFTISLISWLLKNDPLDIDARVLTEFLGLEISEIPVFNYEISQTLFVGILGKFSKHFKMIPAIKHKLKELGLLDKTGKPDLTGSGRLKQLHARSENKIDSICDITDFEAKHLGSELREVVLLDYVGKGDGTGVNILSVFERLKNIQINTKIGILTGTVVVIPEESKKLFYDILQKHGLDKNNALCVDFCKGFLRIETYENINITSIVTQLFYEGGINVLIGTQALLGEGWDSPCVNCLIIASTIGSFMLTNQMRGRALRIDKNNSGKTSNIWHLVSLSGSDSKDWEIACKRFETFEGVSFTDNTIKNGIERLGIIEKDIETLQCKKLNDIMLKRAGKRIELKKQWKQTFEKSAITEANFVSQVYEVVAGEKQKLPAICLKYEDNKLVKLFNKLFLKAKTYYAQKDKIRLAGLILDAMCQTGSLKTLKNNLSIKSFITSDNDAYLTITGCTNYERNLFTKSLCEFFAPPDNPRYILKKADAYIAVPEVFCTNKKSVKNLVKILEPEFGYLDIIFTRTPKGRSELLKAKYNTLFKQQVTKNRIWL